MGGAGSLAHGMPATACPPARRRGLWFKALRAELIFCPGSGGSEQRPGDRDGISQFVFSEEVGWW